MACIFCHLYIPIAVCFCHKVLRLQDTCVQVHIQVIYNLLVIARPIQLLFAKYIPLFLCAQTIICKTLTIKGISYTDTCLHHDALHLIEAMQHHEIRQNLLVLEPVNGSNLTCRAVDESFQLENRIL